MDCGQLTPRMAMPLRITWRTAAASAIARQPERGVVDQHALGVVVAVEFGGQILQVEGDQVRREVARRRLR
jgi:hypothetical protein